MSRRMPPARPARALVAGLAAMAIGGAWAHGGEDHSHDAAGKQLPARPAVAAPGVAASAAGAELPARAADGSLFVPKPVQRQLAIRTAVSAKGRFARVVELPGRVVADPAAAGRVQATQAGTIVAGPQGLAHVGQRVRRGQVLAELQPSVDSASRADREAALAELAAQAELLSRRLDRLQQLEGSVPRKEVEQLRIELDAARARRSALAGALVARLPLVAPVDGVIATAAVVLGQVVDAREVLFEIVDPNRLAVEALAFDNLPLAGVARASARAGDLSFALGFVGAARTLREQALPVLFRVVPAAGSPPPALALGQTVTVFAETAAGHDGVPLPQAALVRDGSGDTRVWVHEAAERFVARRVTVQPLDAERVLAVGGLAGGERVVVQGGAALERIR